VNAFEAVVNAVLIFAEYVKVGKIGTVQTPLLVFKLLKKTASLLTNVEFGTVHPSGVVKPAVSAANISMMIDGYMLASQKEVKVGSDLDIFGLACAHLAKQLLSVELEP
jgi:hypothetical protein